ncbi:hypothetical protein BD779DRAFT_1484414 [Infundibulicybe gibba]|nr:hypothetical protein BD779DRAFT_1484414 [Infundibulicybe gibba]
MANDMPSPSNPELGHTSIDPTQDLSAADELKSEGNAHFREGQWNEALVDVEEADQDPQSNLDIGIRSPGVEEQTKDANLSSETSPDNCAKSRAVLNANIGACHLKLANHKQAVAACSQALLDDPAYIKALQRRAACNEKIGSWSALASAQEDYTKLLKLLPPSSPAIKDVHNSLATLKPRVEAAQKEETAEMMGKLKGIGNSILGNFGLSTDNFKFVPNGQGGYSMNFSQ